MRDKKGIVIIGASYFQNCLIAKAKERGWYTITIDQDSRAIGAAEADLFLQVSTKDIEGIIAALEPVKELFHMCATIGTDMSPSVAAVNKHFNLSGITPAQAEVTTHKGRMREFLGKHNFFQPQFGIFKDKDHISRWMQENKFNSGYVIKPVKNMGARGIMYIEKVDDLSFAYDYAMSFSKERELIIEEYIEADELSVDIMVYNGKSYLTGVADRVIERKDNRYFIETGHNMPSKHAGDVIEKLEELFNKFSAALSMLSGKSYTGVFKGDLRLTPTGEIAIGEIASRLSGGFMSTHTYPYASGNNLLDGYLDLLDGRLPHFISEGLNNQYPNVVIERALIAEPGVIDEFRTVDNYHNSAGELVFSKININRGEIVHSLKNNIGKVANYIIRADSLQKCEECWANIEKKIFLKISHPVYKWREIRESARKNFNPRFCWACESCDGGHCASGVPGMGGTGTMDAFRQNSISLKKYFIQPTYFASDEEDDINVTKEKNVDLETTLFGQKIGSPVLPAPVSGVQTNMGASISEYDFLIELAHGSRLSGVPCVYGDGATFDRYLVALEVMRQTGPGLITLKPRSDLNEIILRGVAAKTAGALAWGIDIDSVALATMERKGINTSSLSVKKLKVLKEKIDLPFFIKGILSVQDARRACEAGAGMVIVGNHGGRVIDSTLSAYDVLRDITDFVKTKYSHIAVYADGGIRGGADVFKALALGADGVMVGRPVAIAGISLGRDGVYSILHGYANELLSIMRAQNIFHTKDITQRYLKEMGPEIWDQP